VRRVRFTPHAEERLTRRDVQRQWAIETVHSPERIEMDLLRPHRRRALRRLPERDNRWLRVVFEEHADEIVIVTVFLDRDARRT
jgi:hypothetical protein